MELSFVRSGGFAGRATNVAGVVHFDGTGAHVTAAGTDYQHVLTTDEAKQLHDLTVANLDASKPASADSHTRDAFQYDVAIKSKDGTTRKLTLGADGADSSLSQWVQREAQKIWEHRLANVPK